MKKIVLSFFSVLLCCVMAVAQNQRVTGTVVDSDGNAVVGATAVVKGTNTAAVTDLDGKYEINAPADAVLVFSYVGMTPIEVSVGGKSVVNVIMAGDATEIDDVVVTALGMTRQQKNLGYASSTVKAEELTQGKGADLVTGLMGKVAGVNITQTGGTGTSTKVIVRGYSSLSSTNQPLYVVDGTPINNSSSGTMDLNNSIDFGSQANDINPEDVESISILKGASATALYGSRAANGVIMITTKKGRAGEKVRVTYDGSFSAMTILRVPQTQQTFGQGWFYSNDGGIGFGVTKDYFGNRGETENGSWGAMLDGREVEWNTGGYYYGAYDSPRTRTYSAKNSVKDFYQTGFETNNTVSVSGGGENTGFYASYGNTYSNGILPGSTDYYKRNTFSFRGNTKINKSMTMSYNINYVRKDVRNAMTGQGHSGATIYNDVLQIPTDLYFPDVKDYTNIYNNPDNYFTPYSKNPYWILDHNYATYQDDRVYGNIELNVKLTDWLTAIGRLGGDFTNSREQKFNDIYSFTEGSFAADFGASAEIGSFSAYSDQWEQIDASAMLAADKEFGNLSLNAVAGWNLNQRSSYSSGGSFQGLLFPGWANFDNNASISPISTYYSRRRLVGAFGQVDLNYKGWANISVSARNDWSSTLPIEDNSYFYWGVNGALILTDALDIKSDVLNFLKIRAAYGTTGNDASVYLTSSPYYYMSTASGGPWASLTFPLGDAAGYNKSTRIPATSLRPEMSQEIEFGFDLRMFNNRLTIDAAFYNRDTKDQIMSLSAASESGFSSKIANVGKIHNHGIELGIGIVPVRTKDFEWDMHGTFTKNWSEVKELYEGTTEIAWQGVGGSPMLYMEVGEPIGVFKFYDYNRVEDPNSEHYGKTIVNGQTGYPSYNTDKMVKYGTSAPDFIVGLTNSFTYKDFSMGFTFDWHHGGKMYSGTAGIMYFTGNAPETAYNNRNPFVYPNSVIDNGDGTYRENNIMVNSSSSMQSYWYDNSNSMMALNNLLDKSYLKLRDLTFTYHLPNKLFGGLIQGIDVSAVGRNLFLWTPKSNTFIDPDINNWGNDLDSEWGEFYAAPSVRTFGGSIKIIF